MEIPIGRCFLKSFKNLEKLIFEGPEKVVPRAGSLVSFWNAGRERREF